MKKFTVQHLATAAVVGAAYAVLSIFGSVFGVTFGPVQCRFAEALCVLPFFFPETAGGLFVGSSSPTFSVLTACWTSS